VRYLADHRDQWGPIQSGIGARLKTNTLAAEWKKARTYLKDLKHFPRYRGSKYDLYHAAARARWCSEATAKQLELANGLEAEIDSSQVILPSGQILFHGSANYDLTAVTPYPTFISTSLNPVVACNSALRRGGMNCKNGLPAVYILTLQCDLPALSGQAGARLGFQARSEIRNDKAVEESTA
jgi:hypothetical protein